MDIWGWIVVYAVGLAVLQLLVYRYLWNRDEPFAERGRPTSEREASDREPLDDRGRHERARRERIRREQADPLGRAMWRAPLESPPNAGDEPAAVRRCPHCGEENEPDPAFTFCRNCAQRLG
ncbi:zinc ribbon domain-containing protein [Halegenticoccus tardaugens]|uniref:zinc ribbon domain-containing protein n=1 Tax=Halegenticoccus tardaugens TaxID=2071624 RepID=UPI00100A4449|nr:zinc ribbon domain-containing protein [Halegenticoccus tardaugens]